MGRKIYFDEDKENAIVEDGDGNLTKLPYNADDEAFSVPRDMLEEIVSTSAGEAEED